MNAQKASPAVIQKTKTDDQSKKEGVLLDQIFRTSLKQLYDKVTAKEAKLTPKDLLLVQELRRVIHVDRLDEQPAFSQCDTCIFAGTCSLYRCGSKCEYDLSSAIDTGESVVKVMTQLLRIEADRIQRALLIEKLDGIVDKEVSAEVMQYFEMVKVMKEIMTEEEELTIKKKKSGALTSMFGDLMQKAKKETCIEAEIVEEPSAPKEIENKPADNPFNEFATVRERVYADRGENPSKD